MIGYRRALIGLLLASAIGGCPARAASLYTIDQRFGTIGFSVHASAFDIAGHFQRFSGTLTLDFEHPPQSQIDVTVDSASATVPVPRGDGMLRSPAYFDVAQFPSLHFQSVSVTEDSDRHYTIHGQMTVRGVTRPMALDAVLTDRIDPAKHPAKADFTATGEIDRTAFGMTADRNFIADTVKLTIHIGLNLTAP